MRYDWSPLWRSTIGFDRLFNVFDEAQRTTEDNYPHYNIERLDESRFQNRPTRSSRSCNLRLPARLDRIY